MTQPDEKLDPESKGTVSFSVRLTEKQRDLLARAAKAQGWTATTLLKNAALERAAHILNTSTPNRVDFRSIAQKVAQEIFTPRRVRVLGSDNVELRDAQTYEELDPETLMHAIPDDEPVVEVSPWHMPPEFADELRSAARYGGTEFLDLLIEASDSIAVRSQPGLPEPIDPSAV